jgi:hypothetical protein
MSHDPQCLGSTSGSAHAHSPSEMQTTVGGAQPHVHVPPAQIVPCRQRFPHEPHDVESDRVSTQLPKQSVSGW